MEEEIGILRYLRDRVREYEQTALHETEGLREHITELFRVVQLLEEQGETDISRYEPAGMPDLEKLQALTWNSLTFLTENQEAIVAAYAHYTEVWEEIIEEIREQRIKKGITLVLWSAVGIAATVLTFGALGPEAVSMETAVLGSFALAYDVSNLEEGALELYYGCVGDINTTAVNPLRDTMFLGWQEGYDAFGLVSNIGFGYYSMRDLASVAGSAAGERIVEGNASAAKIGSTDQTVQRFTREDIINSLDGVTEKSTEIASAIRNKDIGINVLGDDLFESYLGCSSDTVAMQIGDQIYVRSSSSSLLSDVVHEGTHAIDYLNGVEERVIASWTGETAAYSAERLFQIETGMPVQFVSEDDMMVHIWSNYSK